MFRPDFNGAVGDYTMTVSAGPTNVAVGDPVTVRVQISGRGSLDSITLPNQAGWTDFKTLSPTSKTDTSDDLGDEGSKTFEEIVTPENANVHELPPISFSFFNPDDGNYHTLTQPATPLFVTVGRRDAAANGCRGETRKSNTAAAGYRAHPAKFGNVSPRPAPRSSRARHFWRFKAFRSSRFISALVWRKRTDNLANNPRLRRRRAVEQLIASGLDDLNKFAAENKSNEFFAVLFRLLQEAARRTP